MRKREFKIGAIISYFTIILNIVSGIIYTPWLLHMIGDDDYAIYTVATSLINIFLVDFGIGASISKFVSDYVTDGKQQEVQNFMGITYKLYLLIDTVIFLILLVVYLNLNNIYTKFDAVYLHKLKIVFLIVGSYSILQFPFIGLNGVLVSYEKFIFHKSVDFAQKLFIIITMIVVIYNGGGLYELVLVNALFGLLAVGLRYLYTRYILCLRANFKYWNGELVKKIFSFSIWMTVITIVQRLFYNIAPTVLARLGTPSDINFFNFAAILEGYVYTIGIAIYGMFISRVTALSKEEHSQEKMFYLMKLNGRFQMLILGLIVVGWVCLGREFINTIWLGSKYEIVYVLTIILMIPDIFIIPQQIAETILMTQNKIYLQAVAGIIAAIINLILAFLLTPRLGVSGICISIMISNMIKYFILNWMYYNKVSLNVFEFAKEVYWKIGPFQLGIIVVGIFLNRIFSRMSVLDLFVKGIAIVIFYGVMSYFVILSKKEKEIIMKRKG